MRDPTRESSTREPMREPPMTTPVDERRISSMPGRVPDSRIHTPVEGPSQVQNPHLVSSGPPRVPNPNRAENGPPRVPNPNLVETPTRGPQPGYFDNAYGGSPSRPSPTPSATAISKPPEPRKSALSFLLNDDPAPPPPAAPKRVDEVARGMSTTSSPPPQRGIPPPSSAPPTHMRREETPVAFSPYGRTPGPAGIPSLKPYNTPHTQSPQTQHAGIPRSSIVSPIEAADREREFYGRQSYGSQHQIQASGSPHQSHHYPSPSQQSSMAYQSQPQPTSFPAYGAPVSQSHAPSPTMQYAHPSRSREPPRESLFRDSVPPSRDMQYHPPQGQPASATRMQPEASWPVPKPTPAPQPAQSPWASQHGSASKLMRETPQPSWSSAPPAHLNMREERDTRERDPRPDRYAMGLRESPAPPRADERYAMLDSQRAASDSRMAEQRMDPRDQRESRDSRMMGHPHHQHSHSGSIGRVMYNSSPIPQRDHIGGPPSGPPQAQTPAYGQRFSTPAPRGEVPQVPRSYTPVSSAQQQHFEMQMQREREIRDMQMRDREMRERDFQEQRERHAMHQRQLDDEMRRRDMLAAQDLSRMRGGPPPEEQQYGRPGPPPEYRQQFQGELRGAPQPGGPGPVQDHLRRELRPPHEGYPPPGDRRY